MRLHRLKKQYATKLLLIGLFIMVSNGLAQDPNFHIYLCFGQSNMEGQGAIEAQDQTVDSRFQVLQAIDCSNLGRTKSDWYPAVPPLTQCWSKLSPADYFGRTMVENLPDSITVGVINVSVAGCDIRLFDKELYQEFDSTYVDAWFQNKIDDYDRNPYEYLMNLARVAQQDGVIKGILLHQGETNTGNTQWPSFVKTIYNDMLTDLSLDANEVPLLAGELVHADQNGVCASMNTIIVTLPDTIPTAHVISSSGCTAQSDNVHFNSAGYRELGRRYAVQMLSLLADGSVDILDDLAFDHNSGNPFNSETSLRYSVPQTGDVTIEVLDLAGRIVKTFSDHTQSIGEHTTGFDVSDLSSGIYVYRIRTVAGVIQTTKFHLVN